MDYTEFKTHLLTFLWKANDADLVASLDNLIIMANSELGRKLTISEREEVLELSIGDETSLLPDDFSHMITLSYSLGTLVSCTAAKLAEDRLLLAPPGDNGHYRIRGKYLELAGTFDAVSPTTFTIFYRSKIPDFEALDVSYLADDYLDLYTYAVFKHAAPFLREDERVALWKDMYKEALESVLEDDKWNKTYGGSPSRTTMSRTPP